MNSRLIQVDQATRSSARKHCRLGVVSSASLQRNDSTISIKFIANSKIVSFFIQ
jgi:hypothetical protein